MLILPFPVGDGVGALLRPKWWPVNPFPVSYLIFFHLLVHMFMQFSAFHILHICIYCVLYSPVSCKVNMKDGGAYTK